VIYTFCDVTHAWFKYLRGISNGFTEFITNRASPVVDELTKTIFETTYGQTPDYDALPPVG
jgi:hypothetical protein